MLWRQCDKPQSALQRKNTPPLASGQTYVYIFVAVAVLRIRRQFLVDGTPRSAMRHLLRIDFQPTGVSVAI